MFPFLRWVWEWSKERGGLAEMGRPRMHEADMPLGRGRKMATTETPSANGQARTRLIHSLHDLERTMDPLMAAQAYNNRVGLLTRLPEEIILFILGCLGDDVVTLRCLRLVSRVFWQTVNIGDQASWLFHGGYCSFPDALSAQQFRQLIRRDGRCKDCRLWDDTHFLKAETCRFRDAHCNCGWESWQQLYCHACETFHGYCQFDSKNQRVCMHWDQERRCIGVQGSVQLCEHVHITWASIKAHIDGWRQQRHETRSHWQACLDSFLVECHDPVHDLRCTKTGPPTWPRARLCTDPYTSPPKFVRLNLEWAPHAPLDRLPLTDDGRIPASELRGLFRKLRRLGPADVICPPARPSGLPEMAFFSPSSSLGSFVHYTTGEDDKASPPQGPFREISLRRLAFLRDHCFRGYGRGRNVGKIDIRPHNPTCAEDRDVSMQCLEVSYQADITICEWEAMIDTSSKINPTHAWRHAMDADTYQDSGPLEHRPQCKDESCFNYYRRRRGFFSC